MSPLIRRALTLLSLTRKVSVPLENCRLLLIVCEMVAAPVTAPPTLISGATAVVDAANSKSPPVSVYWLGLPEPLTFVRDGSLLGMTGADRSMFKMVVPVVRPKVNDVFGLDVGALPLCQFVPVDQFPFAPPVPVQFVTVCAAACSYRK